MKAARWPQLRAAVALVMTLGMVVLNAHADLTERSPTERAEAFIKDLGSQGYAERERAMKGLVSLGYHARTPVQRLLASPDPEIAERAATLWKALRW